MAWAWGQLLGGGQVDHHVRAELTCRPLTWVPGLLGECSSPRLQSSSECVEEGTAAHSSVPAWRTPWAEEPG